MNDITSTASATVEPTKQSPFQSPGVETTTGQAIYNFPRDHAWHGGAFYQSNDFNEWHYITVLGRDVATGQRISVFWVPLSQGWMATEGRPLHNVLFAFHNLDTGEFHTSMPYVTGLLQTEGSAPDAKDFFFRYAIDDGKNGFTTDYRHATETWTMSGYNTKDNEWNQPFRLDLTATLQAPGYVPMAYWGLESIGVDPQDRQNPETMFGLTYYYTAPKMAAKGTVTLKDRTVTFEGDGWFEHQWGNFRNTLQYRYFWAWFRFNNGDCISFRQYYEGEDFRNPHYIEVIIMSDLIVVAYDDEFKAEEVRLTLTKLQKEHLIELEDAVVVVKKQDGKVKLNQAVNLTAAGAASVGFWGLLVGSLFLIPIGGAAVGAASGALAGKVSDYGIDDAFMKELGTTLEPGHSALFVLVRQATPDKVLEEVKPFGGKVIKTSLSKEAEANLQAALSNA